MDLLSFTCAKKAPMHHAAAMRSSSTTSASSLTELNLMQITGSYNSSKSLPHVNIKDFIKDSNSKVAICI
jgi:hypothetical protein